MPDNELIVLLDNEGNEIGSAPKLASHHANTPLHRAFSCYVFNDQGQLLVTKRAGSKKVWPGVWTNSLCGHPAPGESYQDSITRRAQSELGMDLTGVRVILPDYRYKTPPFQGIIENEACPVFAARAASQPTPNPAEVDSYRWTDWNAYQEQLTQHSDDYSYWAKDQIKYLRSSRLLRQFMG